MYIPFLSTRNPTRSGAKHEERSKLEKRRGGGGGGGRSSGGGGGAKVGSSGGSSGGRASGRTASSADKPPAYSPGSPPPPYSVGGGRATRGSPSVAGGGTPYTIGAGNAFAGRSAGGGTRGQVYSGRGYGGYGASPGFPFMFWPLAFGGGYGYYYGSHIYGPPNNDSRPGGTLQTFTLLPTWETGAASAANGTLAPPSGNGFALYGDANSVNDLIPILASNCSVSTNYGTNLTADPSNAVQYYRGDSFLLLLDGYNNSLPNIEMDSEQNFTIPDVQPAPLPTAVNQTYFNCLNSTIGQYVGLIDADYVTNSAMSKVTGPGMAGTAALVAVVLNLLF